jgi:oxygen-dependent protoporphyrinogen oxidase
VFTTLASGLGALPAAVATASGATVRTGATVRELARTATGWRLTVGSAADPEFIEADAVVLALPARPAARLLSGVAGASAAAAGLAAIEYASMAIVTLAYPRSRFPAAQGPAAQARSGYLIPAAEGRAVKAVTFSTIKWPHLATGDDPIDIIRCSIGRIGEESVLQRDDPDLIALATAELAEETGARGAPVDSRVTRWGGGLPQYTVGHLDRVATIRADVAAQPGLAVCGAAYDGIGIPACIGTARGAADAIRGYFKEMA